MSIQVCSVYMANNLTNATGDGTSVWIPFDTENFDVGDNFNTSTHRFIAPEDGYYLINGAVEVSNLLSSHSTFSIQVQNETANFQNYTHSFNPYPIASTVGATNYVMFPYATILQMDADDELKVGVRVANGTKVVTVNGGYRESTLHVYLLK